MEATCSSTCSTMLSAWLNGQQAQLYAACIGHVLWLRRHGGMGGWGDGGLTVQILKKAVGTGDDGLRFKLVDGLTLG